MSAELVKRESPVETWLHELPERKRSAALQYAAGERSIVTSYLYCSLLGLEASIDDYEAWAIQRWKKLDHRAILETEIMALHDDISEIRRAVEEGKIRMGDAPTKISYLSKELRGHIEHLSREVNMHDRRTLLLAGVEVTSKMLKKVFGRDANVWPAIEAVVESTFADIEAKHQG
jgi:dGTP triphosphohydrolase